MNHLTELRKRLRDAESAYKGADSSLDSSPLEVVVCREEVKQLRFKYSKACEKIVNELLDNQEFEWERFINLEGVCYEQ